MNSGLTWTQTLTESRHITCHREDKSPSVTLMSHKENIGWTKPTLEIWAKPCKNERHIGSIKDLRPPRNNKLTFQLQRTLKTDLCGNFTPEPLRLLRRTDEPPKGPNSCLRLRPRSVLVLSVSCWCYTKLIFTQKISFAEFSVATCRLKHPVRSHLCNLSFGKPLFKGHLHSGDTKFVLILFVSVTSVEGRPQFSGTGHYFWIPKPGFNRHSGDTLVLKTWLTTKKADKFSVH